MKTQHQGKFLFKPKTYSRDDAPKLALILPDH